jgi:hypothetical protein
MFLQTFSLLIGSLVVVFVAALCTRPIPQTDHFSV